MGLVAWWTLNGTLEDISGNENHMIIDKNVTQHTDGKIGSCYYANSQEGYMTSKYEVSLGKHHTYMAWVYPQGVGDHPGDDSMYTGLVSNFLHGDINYNTSARLTKQENGDFSLCLSYSQNEARPTTPLTNATIPANKWSHVAYVVDDTVIKFYINGEHIQTIEIPKSITHKPSKITLFRWATSYSQYVLEGRLNDVRVFDEVVSAKRIKDISNAQIIHYEFNDDYMPTEGENVTIIPDSSGFDNNGRMTLLNKGLFTKDTAVGIGALKANGTTLITLPNKCISKTAPQEWTVSAWIKFDDTVADYQELISLNHAVRLHQGWGRALTYINSGSNDWYRYSTGGLMVGTEWIHFASSFNQEEDRIKIYINGIDETDYGPSGDGTKVPSGIPETITFLKNFLGTCADIRVYAKELSLEDVVNTMQTKGSIHKDGSISTGFIQEEVTFDELAGGVNLVRNGNCEMKTSDNFSGAYVSDDGALGTGCFSKTSGSTMITSSDYIAVDVNCNYRETMYIKSLTEGNSWFGGIVCYDKNKHEIKHEEVEKYDESKTTLAQPLENGQTVVHLTSAAGWQTGTPGVSHHTKQIGIFDRVEAPNYERSSVNALFLTVDTEANTITLKSPWSGGSKPIGTKVANCYDGGTYNYVLGSGAVPMQWTKKTATLTKNYFRFGTAYVKILILANRSGTNPTFRYSNISFVNLSTTQQPNWTTKSVSVTKNAVLQCGEVHEVNYKPTLLDYSDWSLNTEGTIGGWVANGASYENIRTIRLNPVEDLDIVWGTESNDSDSGADGGFMNLGHKIDPSKKYRISCWIRREGAGNGKTYFGCEGSSVCALGANTPLGNPYFIGTTIEQAPELKNNWILFVGYIHPYDYSGTISDPTNGFYKADGTKTRSVTDCRWSQEATTGGIRSFLYYSTSQSEKHYWYRPRFEICDGTEPTIDWLLTCSEHTPMLSRNGTNARINASFGKNGEVQTKEIIIS